MPYIRLRYPFIFLIAAVLALAISNDLEERKHNAIKVHPTPNLAPGYYIVLHTKAKLPQDVHTYSDHNMTYVGPMPNIKACHQSRVKIRPLYPGVETELVKINRQNI